MQTGKILIIVGVVVMLAVDIFILKQPATPQVVMPVAAIKPSIKPGLTRSAMASALPLETPSLEPDPVSDTETNTPLKATPNPQTTGTLAGVDPIQPNQLDFSWSIFDWVEPNQYPMARFALRYVGVDPGAEDYWYAAINDSTLSADERANLIEDLNEEGFPDPENLTADDLPLIDRRIEIIELLGPDAMDEVNAAAFSEAYTDLVNIYYSIADDSLPDGN